MAVIADQKSNVLSSTVPQKLKGNYSLVKGIEILDSNNRTDISNTFNTFGSVLREKNADAKIK
jgi:hypothetical protein